MDPNSYRKVYMLVLLFYVSVFEMSEPKKEICPKCGIPIDICICEKLDKEHQKIKQQEPIIVPRDMNTKKYECPENERCWSTPNEWSPEFEKMLNDLGFIVSYIAKNLNEGPEVKDNTNKRLIALRAVLKTLLSSTLLNSYQRYGLLSQLLIETYIEDRERKILEIMQAQMQKQQKKRSEYLA